MDVWAAMGLAGKRAIIVHHDDLGLTLSTNLAYQRLGFPTGSIMMPGVWAPQLQAGDLGVHLTLTSEWAYPRLRPITGPSSLCDAQGYFWASLEQTWTHARLDDAQAELRAQLAASYKWGLDVTHLDTHMGAVLRPDIADVYLRLALDHRLPCLLPESLDEVAMPAAMRGPLEDLLSGCPLPRVRMIDTYAAPVAQRTEWYRETLAALAPGVYHLRHHAAAPGPETELLPDADKRLGDFAALQDPQVLQLLQGFTLLSYRQIRDAWRSLPQV